jgi:hypothetical protein
MTVVIGRCHFGAVDPMWYVSYEHLQKPVRPDGTSDCAEDAVTFRMPTPMARNLIVRAMLGKEAAPEEYATASHLFFIDDDTLVPPDGLLKLLAHDVPIVSGFYTQRRAPFWPIPVRECGKQYVHITKYCKGLQEVDGVGAGCLLIKREVLEAMSEPYFHYWSDRMNDMTTEDIYFCEKARELGYPILLDFDVQCRHITTVPVGWDNWLQASAGASSHIGEGDSDEMNRLRTTVIPWKPKPTKPVKMAKPRARKKAS